MEAATPLAHTLAMEAGTLYLPTGQTAEEHEYTTQDPQRDMESHTHLARRSKAGAMEEDRLSSLPDDLLHSILRGVPLKHAARTSALSRRWVAHWISALAANPVLDFTDSNFARGQPPARAAATVDRCLRLHAEHGTPLHAFRVALVSPSAPGDGAFGRDVVGWIAAAVARGAREVDADLLPPSQEDPGTGSAAFRLELPRDLFRARNSLERLALGRLSLRAVPLPAAGLAGLRSLSLSHADVTDEALRGVLASCGALESLSLRCCSLLTAMSVASDRLRVLELLGCRAVRELRVAAPALESFTLYGDVILCVAAWSHSVAVDFDAAPALRDVYLSQMECCGYIDPNDDYYYPFVYYVPQARILTLCSAGLVVPIFEPHDDDYDHFPYANFNTRGYAYIDMPNLQELQLLLGSLEEGSSRRFPEHVYYFFNYTSLPVLERLFIRLSSDNHADGSFSESDEDEDDERIVFRSEEIVLGQLTFMKVVDFRGTWRERRLVAYLLKRAPILEQLVLVTVAGAGATGDEQSEEGASGDGQSEEGAPGDEQSEGASGDERPKNIKEWASRLEKASREARITVCRPSEDDSPNHAHTRLFHEEYCCP